LTIEGNEDEIKRMFNYIMQKGEKINNKKDEEFKKIFGSDKDKI
jgi:hypothetical protein